MRSRVGVPRSFELGPEDLSKLAGIRVSAKEVERVSEMGDGQVEEFPASKAEAALSDRIVPVKPIPRMDGGTDGSGVPVGKKETEGRQGKEEDGQAKTREIKLGCMFTPTGWMRKIVWYAMRSHPTLRGIESAEAFGPRIYQEAKHRSLDRAAEVCGLGDGAFWIWNITDEPFSGAHPLSICSLSASLMGTSPGPALGRRKKPSPRDGRPPPRTGRWQGK